MLPHFCVIVGHSRNWTVHNGGCTLCTGKYVTVLVVLHPIAGFSRCFWGVVFIFRWKRKWNLVSSQNCEVEFRKITKFITMIINLSLIRSGSPNWENSKNSPNWEKSKLYNSNPTCSHCTIWYQGSNTTRQPWSILPTTCIRLASTHWLYFLETLYLFII